MSSCPFQADDQERHSGERGGDPRPRWQRERDAEGVEQIDDDPDDNESDEGAGHAGPDGDPRPAPTRPVGRGPHDEREGNNDRG
jgi:hypothetical protein